MSRIRLLKIDKIGMLSILYVTATFCLLYPFASLDFDQHHDGYVSGSALGIASGLLQFKEVYSQYGPIHPILQSLFIELSNTPALNLRLLNIILIAFTSGLMVNLLRFKGEFLEIYKPAVLVSPVIWVAINDGIYGTSILPWNSTLFAFHQILFLNAFLFFLSKKDKSSKLNNYIVPLFVGFIGALSVYIRVNTGLVMFFSIIGVLLVLSFTANTNEFRQKLRNVFIGMFSGVGFIALSLLFRSNLGGYFEQSILIPRKMMLSEFMMNAWNPKTVILQYLLNATPFVVVVLTLFYIIKKVLKAKILSTEKIAISWIISLITVYLFSGDIFRNVFAGEFHGPNLSQWIITRIFALFIVTSFGYLALTLFKTLRKQKFSEGLMHEASNKFLIIALAFSGLVQIYPTTDTRHIWWGLLLPIYFITNLVSSFVAKQNERYSMHAVLPMVVAVLVLSTFAGAKTLNVERVEVNFGVASGMKVSPEIYKKLKIENTFLETNLDLVRGARFKCRDGFYSVFNGEYNSGSKWFVDWTEYETWRPADFDQVLNQPSSIVFCGDIESAKTYSDVVDGEIIDSISSLSLIKLRN